MSKTPFVRFYGNDWFTGTAGLKADERGVYISMCAFIWNTGRRVPLDDAEAARLMALNFKSYQRVRDRLVVLGKVTRHENGYGNERAEHELAAAEAAAAEAASRKAGRSNAIATGGDGSGEAPPSENGKALAQDAKADKPILINGTIDHGINDGIDCAIDHGIDRQKTQRNQPPFIEPKPEPVKEPENKLTDAPASVSQLAAPDDLKSAFNGTTDAMLSDLVQWMGPHAKLDNARKWLATTLSASGRDATINAYQALVAGQGQGTPIADPIRYWAKTAQTMKAGAAPPRVSASRPDNRPAWAVEKDRKKKAALEAVFGVRQ